MRERAKSEWGVFDLQPPLLSFEPPGGVQRKPSTSSTRGVRKCKYTWDPPAWHRSRTLRVHLCSTFFARIGQLGLWKVLSHERHQPTPPPVQYFPSKFEFLWGRKGATNYLLFTAIPLYQWTFAWPHEKRLPPQSSGFFGSSLHCTYICSMSQPLRFLGPNKRPDSSASISHLSSAEKRFWWICSRSVFYLIFSIALRHKPNFFLWPISSDSNCFVYLSSGKRWTWLTSGVHLWPSLRPCWALLVHPLRKFCSFILYSSVFC